MESDNKRHEFTAGNGINCSACGECEESDIHGKGYGKPAAPKDAYVAYTKQAAPVSAPTNYASLADEPIGEPRPPQPRETPESLCCGLLMRDDTAFYTCPCGNQYGAGDTFGFPLKLIGRLQPMRVSAGEILCDICRNPIRWTGSVYVHKAGFATTSHDDRPDQTTVAALQSRIATLEATIQRNQAAIFDGGLELTTEPDWKIGCRNVRAESLASELAAFKASLPERANAESLNAWSAKIHELNAKWWVDLETGTPLKRNVGELLMLCVSELSEAMEGHRKNLMDDKLPHRKMFEVELADCMIRIFDIAAGFGLDLGAAVVEKCEYNKTRADHQPEARKQANGKKY